MAELYGYPFINQFGEKDNGTWFNGLKDLTVNDLAYGVKQCFDREEKVWPPGLVEFRRLCRPAKRLASFHRMFKSLPKPEPTIELGEKTLEQIRKILHGGDNVTT